MLQKLNAEKLIASFLAAPARDTMTFVLAGEPIYRRLARAQLEAVAAKLTDVSVQSCSGKTWAQDVVDVLSQGGLFGAETQLLLVEPPEKLTAADWKKALALLARLPRPPPCIATVLLTQNARGIVTPESVEGLGPVALAFPPLENELPRRVDALLRRYPFAKALSNPERLEMVHKARTFYAGDLLAVDLHFDRMQQQKVTFEEALGEGRAEVTAFHVLDALAAGDSSLLDMRLRQCEGAGVEPQAILGSCIAFFRQLAGVQAALRDSGQMRAALDAEHIPFPSHARFERAVRNLDASKVRRFFACAAKLELELRMQREPAAWLAVELSGLLMSRA